MESPSKWLRKGAWTAEEDTLLRQCIDKHGEGKWNRIPLRAGLNRCRKSCRLRWLNYLKPTIKKGKFSVDEVDLILRLHKLLGNRWSLIAGRLPGRTGNDVKNYWNTNFGKKQEPCCESKTRKTYIALSDTTPAQNLDIIRPRPRSPSVNNVNGRNWLNGLPEIDHGEVNNLTVGESVKWESLLEESQQTDVLNSKATPTEKEETLADCSLFNSTSFTFDVEEKDKFVNYLIDGERMWWESLPEESQQTDVLNSKATATEKEETLADSSLFKSTSFTFDVEEKEKFVNYLIDGERMWWESLPEESPETDVLNSKATATEMGETTSDSSLLNSMSSTFNVEELWSMFVAETGELD